MACRSCEGLYSLTQCVRTSGSRHKPSKSSFRAAFAAEIAKLATVTCGAVTQAEVFDLTCGFAWGGGMKACNVGSDRQQETFV